MTTIDTAKITTALLISISKVLKESSRNTSIHPRVWAYSTSDSRKRNTCLQPRCSTIQRKLEALQAHSIRHPRCLHTRSHIKLLEKKMEKAI